MGYLLTTADCLLTLMSDLPKPIKDLVAPIFEARPLAKAMSRLVVTERESTPLVEEVDRIIQYPALNNCPPLVAGLWLYVDQLDASHKISQQIDDATGSFWHGIMHRREGDFSNSHYWFRRVGHHPAMAAIDVPGGYDDHALIDQVEQAHRQGQAPASLIECQRREWMALFHYCATT